MRPEDPAAENSRANFLRGLGRQFMEMRQVIGALGFEGASSPRTIEASALVPSRREYSGMPGGSRGG
jgi:hypothetical protein